MYEKGKLYRRVWVWSWALRIFHWSFALSCAVLLLTGAYIHHPFSTGWPEGSSGFFMANMRYYHFAAGFVFMSALAVRVYLLLFGNRWERFTDFLPITRRNIGSFFNAILYYLYLTDSHKWRRGHNALAGTVYFLMFVLAAIIVLSGLFMLYPEVSWIEGMGVSLFGSVQQARFIHYIVNWLFLVFVLIHIYIVVWNDLRSSEGLVSGIFSGRKFLPADVEED